MWKLLFLGDLCCGCTVALLHWCENDCFVPHCKDCEICSFALFRSKCSCTSTGKQLLFRFMLPCEDHVKSEGMLQLKSRMHVMILALSLLWLDTYFTIFFRLFVTIWQLQVLAWLGIFWLYWWNWNFSKNKKKMSWTNPAKNILQICGMSPTTPFVSLLVCWSVEQFHC